MRLRNYMNKYERLVEDNALLQDAEVSNFVPRQRFKFRKKVLAFSMAFVISMLIIFALVNSETPEVAFNNLADLDVEITPIAAATVKTSTIAVPAGMVKSNPFLPYRDIASTVTVSDEPAYALHEPPVTVAEGSDAMRVMDTMVSGILYDKFSPSAILNIEGNDYLVKKGDVVNNYKVVSILQDSVTVKLGANVYKAGIGEILTEGSLHHNDVSNLSNKFGGEK